MRREWTSILVLVSFALITGAAGASAEEYQYVGVSKCKSCHKKELIGNQYGVWQKTKHSGAFEALKGEEAVKIAKEKGIAGPPHEAKECLKCHVTAYGEPATAFAKNPLKPANGVQCESCHGPGSGYKKKKTMADHDLAVAAGLQVPDAKTCAKCHNEESPTWDAAKGFDFEAAKEKIAHPIPEDVKGKYIEMEKKLKAEKKAQGAEEEEEEE